MLLSLLRRLARDRPRRAARREAARPLRVYRLERRRVLSADFALAGGGLVLDGFDAGETLTISQDGDSYDFTVGSGGWDPIGAGAGDGASVDGRTLSLTADAIAGLTGGVSVVGSGEAPLSVFFGQADFSAMPGALSVVGATSVGQQPFSLLTAPGSSPLLVASPTAGLTVGSLNVAGDFTLTAFGPIVDGPGTEIMVAGDATFTSLRQLPDADFDSSGVVDAADQGIWAANYGTATGATRSTGDANGDGRVDAADYTVVRATLGETAVDGGITLADSPGDVLTVDGTATFNAFASLATAGAGDRFDIAIGDPAGGVVNLGSFSSTGADVSLDEASGTTLAAVDAENLEVSSAGAIDDSRTDGESGSDASIAATGDATLTAAGAITLNDESAESFTVGGKTSFTGATITIGEAGTFNTVTLQFNAAGLVSIQEDSGTEIAMSNTAGGLSLSSDGAITDAAGTSIDVTGDATLTAVDAITLNDDAGDTLTTSGKTSLTGATITVGAAGTFNTGTLQFNAAGLVWIEEDSGTEIAMSNTAGGLSLSSDGAITDAAGTSVDVTGDATLTAVDAITLNDDAGDTLTTSGKTSLTGATVTVGEAGAFNTGTLQFNAAALVTIEEDSATELAMGSTAGTLDLASDGQLTDESTATLFVSGDAAVFAASGIVIADDNFAPNGNSVAVAGFASFEVGAGQSIDIGVISDGSPNDGLPAAAIADFGSLQFTAEGGAVRLAEDSGTVLGGSSSATTAALLSAGSITDAPGAATTIPGSAELVALGGDVVLGDAGATFDMGAPALFDAGMFLAIEAMNVSVEADSPVNLRTGAADPAIPGVFFLTAAGDVSQVGDAAGVVTPLTAGRVAIDSEGAVLLSAVDVTAPIAGDAPANLAVHAGEPVDVAALDAAGADAFPTAIIPGDTTTDLSPIGVGPSTAAPQPSGLVTLEGAVIDAAAAIGDGYSIVVVVDGDAKVGEVADATGTQPNLVGLDVGTAGNAFLQTTPSASGTEAGELVFSAVAATPGLPDVPDGVVAHLAGGVLTAVAAATLRIDTSEPDEALPAVARTTKLRSATGTVTSVAPFTAIDALTGDELAVVGPRLLVDFPDDAANAATTDLVLSSTDFLQLLTAAIGSRGEDNLVVVVDWADVVDPLVPDRPPARVPLDPATPGVDALPEAALAPVAIEANTPDPGLAQSSDPPLDFRVVTIPHFFDESFIPANPLIDTLPTLITVFNDPAINLFDQFVETTDGVEARDLNSNAIGYSSSVRAAEIGFSLPLPRDAAPVFAPPAPTLFVDATTAAKEQAIVDGGRSIVNASVEVVLYGRVDPDDPTQWAADVPGEQWPQQWPNADGDFLQDIRELVDEGPSSEGRYRVVVETSRGVQPLEEWVKGDLVEASDGAVGNEAPPEADEQDGDAVVDPAAAAAWNVEAVDATMGALAPAETRVGPPRVEVDAPDAPVGAVVGPVAGAAVSLGAWRRRFALGDRLRFDDDGVGFTRVQRRRRSGRRSG